MRSDTNKHGYVGVRKRTDHPNRAHPYYARMSIGTNQFIYSKDVATAEEAGHAFDLMKVAKEISGQ